MLNVLFAVKLKHQPNGQTMGSGYLGTYGASFNTAAVAAAAAGQTGQYPYGSSFTSPANTASSSTFSSSQQVGTIRCLFVCRAPMKTSFNYLGLPLVIKCNKYIETKHLSGCFPLRFCKSNWGNSLEDHHGISLLWLYNLACTISSEPLFICK